ncbi:MAG: hypothetical protein JAY90_20220 [Candidatus Thiodiazotropha lotti]|nr:hypothetical protein [Candidatus Thiodiazotropha lotti]
MSDKSLEPIRPPVFKLAEHAYRCFDVIVPQGITPDDLMNPVLYQNVASRITQYNEIRVIAEDGSYMARLLVMFVRGTDVKTQILECYKFSDTDYVSDQEAEYFVEVRGSKGWCVIKRSDGTRVIENISDRATAERELNDYLKALKS